MPVRIVDASAMGALIFGEPKAREIAKALEDSQMAAPALIWFELASICLRKIITHPAQGDQILRAFNLARELPIQIVEVDHWAVVTVAYETGLTTYDASYLWLARHLRGELVTLDRKLRRATSGTLSKTFT
jgi:predicted nucleic acid-binding protein